MCVYRGLCVGVGEVVAVTSSCVTLMAFIALYADKLQPMTIYWQLSCDETLKICVSITLKTFELCLTKGHVPNGQSHSGSGQQRMIWQATRRPFSAFWQKRHVLCLPLHVSCILLSLYHSEVFNLCQTDMFSFVFPVNLTWLTFVFFFICCRWKLLTS